MGSQSSPPPLPEFPDFSIVLGGPLYQILRRSNLTGDRMELLRRRITFLVLITWMPLFLLSVVEGRAWGQSVKLPFLLDVDVNARFLLALPLFVVAELVVHERMRTVVGAFVNRGLVPEEARARFGAAITSAMRLRNSMLVELLMIALVYGVGVLVVWRTRAAIDVSTWYGFAGGEKLQPTMAGLWFGCVSLPLIQFILLRWYFRLFVWTRFLWDVSHVGLDLVPTHPDRAGGLGFLSTITYAFAPLLAGQGVLLASVMANKIFYDGARFLDFKMELVAWATGMLFFVLAPLLVFVPLLARTKRIGLAEYGELAQRYVREFEDKWLRGGAPAGEQLVGSGDIQSLADLGNSFEIVKNMKPVPFGRDTVFQLAVISLAPVAPLILTTIPLGQLVDKFFTVIF